jgi:hypothetical protein
MKTLEIKIDYFSATFPLNVDEQDSLLFKVHEMVRLIAVYMNVKPFEIVRSKYSQNNYNYQYMLGEYIILRLDGPLNASYQRTCHLEMKGDACRDFETRNKDKNWINLILFMAQLNANFKRIDIAIDDFKGDVVNLPWILDKINKRLYTSVFKSRPRPIGNIEDGMTIQFGGNNSEIELVIYDKHMERITRRKSDTHAYWLRYEMRFRNNNASRVAYKLASLYAKDDVPLYGTKIQTFAFEQLYRIVDFKEETNFNQHNMNLAKTDPKWLEFLHNVEKGELRKPEDDNPLPPSFDAYLEQALPYMVMLLVIKYYQLRKDNNLFDIEVRKMVMDNLTFSKKRFQKLNIYLDQLACKTIDDKELEILKKEFEGVISERTLPF